MRRQMGEGKIQDTQDTRHKEQGTRNKRQGTDHEQSTMNQEQHEI